MYAMLTAVAAASMWFFVGFMRASNAEARSRRRLASILILGCVNALGMYTHVVYALVMVTQGVMALLWLGSALLESWRTSRGVQQAWGCAMSCLLANVLTLLLFAPWLDTALTQVFAQPNLGAAAPLADILRQLQGYLAFGSAFELSMGNLGFVIYFFLLFGLLVHESRGRGWWNMLLPALWVVISVSLYLQFDLGMRYLRFMLPAQLGFALWMGRGVWMLWTRPTRDRHRLLRFVPKLAALLASGAILLSMFDALPDLYHHDDFQRDDVRGLVAQIEMELDEGDAIIVSAAGFEEVLGYYTRGEAAVYGLPTSADDDITRMQARDIISEHDRIYAVFYGAAEQDPRGIVEATLNRDAFEISDEWIGDVRFARYISPAAFESPQNVHQRFGDHIVLQSAALSAGSVRPGDVLQMQLIWTTEAVHDKRFKVFLQLLDADGVLAAQRDSEPGGGSLPTTSWETGVAIQDNHALRIPATLSAGDYTLIAGLYDINDAWARLPVAGESYLELAAIRVE